MQRDANYLLSQFPRVELGHLPTPLELMPRLSGRFDQLEIFVKRDDCTGLGFGGNKVRQLEYYLGDALARGCDTVLSTGAVQSNYMRTLAAAAGKLGLECHIQLEDRVANKTIDYQRSGNRMLTAMFGANLTFYPEGEDEQGADREIHRLANELAQNGKMPYVVPLAPTKEPKGALGYVQTAGELLRQIDEMNLNPDLVVVGSGSGLTHSGLLFGLRLYGSPLQVLGACVRRDAELQAPRILSHCDNLAAMMEIDSIVTADDVWVNDSALAPGYGMASPIVQRAISLAATCEGLLTDPVYSGKTLGCLLHLLETQQLSDVRQIIFVHTGGTPALFAYREEAENYYKSAE